MGKIHDKPLDELYLIWLYSNIGVVKVQTPTRTHWELVKLLYKTPFYWSVFMDENRADEGKYLREEFVDMCYIDDPDLNWLEMDCSVLEMLIALSQRAAFEDGGTVRDWFWEMLSNAGIYMAETTDKNFDKNVASKVEFILKRVMDRRYGWNGYGGFFPLNHPKEDQRKVEIWYQLNAYLLDE